jgi:WD40 repeat protein
MAEPNEGRPQPLPPELERESEALSDLLLELASAPARDPAALGPPLGPGTRVGRFELLREVGRGGFGVVYEARDTELGRLVAFKAMRPSRARADALEKPLREEAEAAARLNHPNVVTLHDYGIHLGTPYLILELLRGETLQQRLGRGPLPPAEALRVLFGVARGLAHAHAQGVFHRDLKPGNVFLTGDGGVKLVDFGLARLLDRASLAGGTPAYMAPEQLRGQPGDARTDVFGAAVLLFHALSGRLPFPAVDGRSTVLDPGPPPPLPLEDAPPELAALVASALSRDPAGRPQTAAALLEGLEGVSRAYAEREAARHRAARRRRLRRAAAAVGGVALLGASAAAAIAARARTDAERVLRATRIASAADATADPLVAALLMAELDGDAPPRAVEIAQRILAEPIPVAALDLPRGGIGLAPSPDGRLVAAGTLEGGVALWRADGTGPARLLRDGGGRTNDLAFTPDSARLVAAGHDGDVRVWRTDAPGPPTVLAAGTSPLVHVRVSPDGRTAAAGALDGRAWLLDLDGARPARALVHDGAVFALAFSPDGTRLATGSGDGHLRLFHAAGGALLAKVPVAGGAIFDLAWAPGGGALAVASEDGVARRFGPDGAPMGAFNPLAAGEARVALGSIAWSPDGGRLAAASLDGTARVWPAAGGAEVRLAGHRERVLRVVFSPDGAKVLTTAWDGTARLWSADGTGEPVVFRAPGSFDVAFSPDGGRVFTRSKDVVRIWPAGDPHGRAVLRGHRELVDTVVWTRDGERLVTASHDGTARIWPASGGEPLLVLHDGGGCMHSASLDAAERLLLTSSEDGSVRLWDAATGALVRTFRRHESPVLSAAFSPDGERIASGALDRTVHVFRTDGTGTPLVLRGHEGGVTSVAWTPDGRSVVSASQFDRSVRIWPADGSPARVLRFDRGVFRATPTPDGTRLLVAEEDGPLHVHRLDTLAELPPLPALPEGLLAAAASEDGRLVALASIDGLVRVFPADGTAEPIRLRGHDQAVGHAAFSPDGTRLATASRDGTARVFTISWDRLRASLRAATSACLPAQHRAQILGEAPAEAERAHGACERAHGREPLRAEPPAAAPSASVRRDAAEGRP